MFSEKQFRAWREGNKGPNDSERQAAIRSQVETEIAGYDADRRARDERQEGQRMTENALRHRRAVERPRDVRPQEPVGTERHAHDGTIWIRKA